MKEGNTVWTIHVRKDLDAAVAKAANELQQPKSEFIRASVRKSLEHIEQ